MTHLKPGDIAPPFSFENPEGKTITLDSYKGKKLILYFYPKDNTLGCTAEARNLKASYQIFKDKGFEILGVSPDDAYSHFKFTKRLELPFELISDTDKKVINDYGVWGEIQMFGKVFDSVNRTTFVIDEKGVIEKIFNKVKNKKHSQQILNEY